MQSQSEFQLSAQLKEQALLKQSVAKLEDKVLTKQKTLVNIKSNVKVKQ